MELGGSLPRGWQLGLTAVVGIALMWYFEHGIFYGLGETIVIACFLAFTIDRWFKEDLAKSAYWAAFGDVINPSFRDEIQHIANLKWLGSECECRFTLEDMGAGVIKVTMALSKWNENISSETQEIQASIGIDEWGVPGHQSMVEKCGLQLANGKIIEAVEDGRDTHHISWKSKKVTVKRGERVKTFSKSIEYRKSNDIYVLAFKHATKDPEIEVKAPESITAEVGASPGGH